MTYVLYRKLLVSTHSTDTKFFRYGLHKDINRLLTALKLLRNSIYMYVYKYLYALEAWL